MKRFDTDAVHAGEHYPKPHDAIATPISSTATYVFQDTAELHDFFQGRIQREEYGRYGNPTVQEAERKLAALEGADDCALFSSGMAAITTTMLAMLRKDQHVILTSDCYRRTRQFVATALSRFGIEHTLVAPDDLDALEAAIDEGRTRLVVTELPTNPYLRCPDLEALIARVKKYRGIKVIVDATFATPANLRPLEWGADLVTHSCTKYIAGHNDVLAGSIAGQAGLVQAIREFRGVTGAVLDAHAAYLVLRGAKTLGLRVARQNASGLAMAQFLEAHPKVTKVWYPGLASHPDHAHAIKLMSGFGGVVSFEIDASLDEISRFIDACEIPAIGPSLGGVESLIEQPSLMSFYELTTQERLAIGIKDNLVRFALGIEDINDLIADIDNALQAL